MAALEVVNQQSRHPLRTELRRQFVRLTLLRGEEASRAEPALRDSWQCLKSDHFNVGQPIGELVPKVSGRQPGMIKEKRSSLDLTGRRRERAIWPIIDLPQESCRCNENRHNGPLDPSRRTWQCTQQILT